MAIKWKRTLYASEKEFLSMKKQLALSAMELNDRKGYVKCEQRDLTNFRNETWKIYSDLLMWTSVRRLKSEEIFKSELAPDKRRLMAYIQADEYFREHIRKTYLDDALEYRYLFLKHMIMCNRWIKKTENILNEKLDFKNKDVNHVIKIFIIYSILLKNMDRYAETRNGKMKTVFHLNRKYLIDIIYKIQKEYSYYIQYTNAEKQIKEIVDKM